jgi:hypothetical protein
LFLNCVISVFSLANKPVPSVTDVRSFNLVTCFANISRLSNFKPATLFSSLESSKVAFSISFDNSPVKSGITKFSIPFTASTNF